ncbi:MAG: hypothetical protein OXK77_04975 [Gemmatimonadota bacterium]|nr:hypothetical protein [Gemmatimonadota bacterium]MDE2864236.1 hypothetical protein [Gemmatimonadota bacterium]MXV97021.1 alpha/beta hydrolase [Gemmatimonadota bacterium]MYB07830.1 alpha/beta hydrolase [Gemmatimonadota bacterium]MYE16223.1 alpha/beta hydrolase [Gemmatimonadota bacterium]
MNRRRFVGTATATATAPLLACRGTEDGGEAQAPVPQRRPFEIYETETFVMNSASVGDDFLIAVSLPASYGTGERSYRLVYVLDANISFGMTVEIARLFQVDLIRPGMPEMVLVGIGYPEPPMAGILRARDLTPAGSLSDDIVEALQSAEVYEGHGGAAEFLRFIEDELHPRIVGDYRVETEGTGFLGDSFGGLFTAYAFQQRSPIFDRYWMGSPGLLPADELLEGLPAAIAQGFERDTRVFVTMGELEETGAVGIYNDLAVGTRRLLDIFEANPAENLTVTSRVYPDATHITTVPPALTDAFTALFMG